MDDHPGIILNLFVNYHCYSFNTQPKDNVILKTGSQYGFCFCVFEPSRRFYPLGI